MSPTAVRTLRLGGSIVLLALVIAILPRGEITAALRQASPLVLGGSLIAFLVCHVMAAFKWRMLGGRSTDVTFGKALRAHFSGLVGTLTPLGMIGGDVVRASVAMKGSSQSSAIVLTSIVDRVVDTAALVILASIGFAWIGGQSVTATTVLAAGIAVAVSGIGAVAVAHALLKRTRHLRLARLRVASDMLMRHPVLIAQALALSILIQGTLITVNAVIGTSVGVDVSFAAWLLAWPAAKFVAYLPIGIAGIGVRETALVALMRPLGGAAGPVLAAGLLWDAVLIAGSVGGWLMLSAFRVSQPVPPGFQKT